MGKGLVFFGLLIVLALAAIAALLYRPATVIGTSEKSLAYSVRQEAGAARGGCRGEDDEFTCAVAGDSGDSAAYGVSVDEYGCWDAKPRARGARAGGDGTLSGCITVVDLLRLDD